MLTGPSQIASFIQSLVFSMTIVEAILQSLRFQHSEVVCRSEQKNYNSTKHSYLDVSCD